MKILIISANTYPLQGPRAFRTAELSECLAKKGHQVTLYTVHGNIKYDDYEVITGIKMRNVNHALSLSGNDGSARYNCIDKLMFHYFHRLLCWPQIEFLFRVSGIIKENPNADVLITIAFPHSIHWGAALAKKKYPDIFPKRWIADCGDPFCLNPLEPQPRYFRKFEKGFCSMVDYITVPTEESKDGYFPEFRNKIKVIPQGFDFSKTPIAEYKKNAVPTFLFTGSVYAGKRDPRRFMDYLLSLDIDYKFYLYMRSPLDKKYEELSNGKIQYMIGYGRKDIILACSKMDFLINIKNPSSVQTPSKLIDYGISKRPILDISNDFKEQDDFKEFINGNYQNSMKIPGIDDYRIETICAKFESLF